MKKNEGMIMHDQKCQRDCEMYDEDVTMEIEYPEYNMERARLRSPRERRNTRISGDAENWIAKIDK